MNEISPAILKRAQRGDPAAQEEFLRCYSGRVWALVRRFGVAGDEEDQMQEVLAHLLRVLPKFDPHGTAQLGTWVHTVTNRWMGMQKRRRSLTLAPLEAAWEVPDHQPSGEAVVERRQLMDLLSEAVERLSESHRRVFVATQIHQLSLQEVADTERVSLGTVKSRLHRARAELVMSLGVALDSDSIHGGIDVADE